jgi:hypothetical protein
MSYSTSRPTQLTLPPNRQYSPFRSPRVRLATCPP